MFARQCKDFQTQRDSSYDRRRRGGEYKADRGGDERARENR